MKHPIVIVLTFYALKLECELQLLRSELVFPFLCSYQIRVWGLTLETQVSVLRSSIE
ncbi:hypothetical protein KCTC52924_00577 [Arenibacter antarcticus]